MSKAIITTVLIVEGITFLAMGAFTGCLVIEKHKQTRRNKNFCRKHNMKYSK